MVGEQAQVLWFAPIDPTLTGTKRINICVDGVPAMAYNYQNSEGELTVFRRVAKGALPKFAVAEFAKIQMDNAFLLPL